MSDHKCAGEVWQMQGFFPCTKTGRHKHEGKWYCKLHHPPTVQAKRAASRDRWNAKWAAQEQARVEAELAQDEMKRKAAAYDGLVAERDALKDHVHRLESLCHDMAGELTVLRAIKQMQAALPETLKRGCRVCGIGADGKAYGYVCSRSDCPTRITCGGDK